MKKVLFSVVLVLFFGLSDVLAQCAMCRATVENNVNNGEIGLAPGLNFGIMYLFAAPYVLVMVIAFLWYRQSKKKKKAINIKDLLSRNKY
jgi:hypothetical protein